MSSRRGYVTTTEVDALIGSGTVVDNQINEAEEIIDAFVGPQLKFLDYELKGRLQSSGSQTVHTLDVNHQNSMQNDYLKGCEIEIIGGTGIGERKKITASTYAGAITTEAFTVSLDSTSVYIIYQLGKFPRKCDGYFDGTNVPNTYYKRIPEQIKRATAMQVEYMVRMGDAFFQTDKTGKKSESIGDYSYTMGDNSGGINRLIAPKAKQALRGIVNRIGEFV